MEFDHEPIMAPQIQVVKVNVPQYSSRSVVVLARVTEVKLGELRRQVFNGFPVLTRFACLLEVLRAAMQQGELGVGRAVFDKTIRLLTLEYTGKCVCPIDRVQVVATSFS